MIHSRLAPLLLALALAPPAFAETVSGRIVAVGDGDTVTLVDSNRQQHTIRLAGIDAPERTQSFGDKARTHLAALALDKPASADCRKRDHRQRGVCVVLVEGRDIGLEQVRMGYAWWYRPGLAEQRGQERADYERAEFNAKVRRLGLWNSTHPLPPWDWRHNVLDE